MSNLQIYHMNGLIWVNEKQKHYKRRGERASNKNTKKLKNNTQTKAVRNNNIKSKNERTNKNKRKQEQINK